MCRQQYDKGTVVDKGSTIKVYLSLGSDKFEINSKLYVNGNVSILKYYLRSFKDIDVEYVGEYSEEYAKDMVLRMEPDKGYLQAGDSLKVYISLGPEYIDVPNLYGMTKQQAIAKIEQAGFSVGTISEVNSDNTEVGQVCGQSLDPGTSQKSGTEIAFSISLGPKMAVSGLSVIQQKDRYSAIGSANLYYSIEYAESTSVPAGTVISQVPEGGTSVPEYSTVKLVISVGPPTVGLGANDLTNMTQEQATSTLAGMSLGARIQYESSDYVAVGSVTRWAATSAWILHAGDTVIVL
ncbi:MAG: PASTA domain-containing protein [Lachnospiraceae bacterium]